MSSKARLALLACAAWSVTLGSAARADDIVVPNALAAAEGNGSNQNPFNSAAATAQVMISASQLTNVSAGDVITGVRFRLNGLFGAAPGVATTWADYEITLAEAATTIASASLTYANNMTNPVLVHDGSLSVASNSYPGGASPNAFGPLIFFNQTSYVYQGGDLVMLLSHTSSNGTITVDSATSMASGYGTDFRALLATGFNSPTAVSNTGSFPVIQFEFTPVPEPSSWALGCTALAASTLAARLRFKSP